MKIHYTMDKRWAVGYLVLIKYRSKLFVPMYLPTMSGTNTNLLCLRSGAPGLPRRYLQENIAPYHVLDQMGNVRPLIILAIGGQAKRQLLPLSRSNRADQFTVQLRRWLDSNKLILDCELHRQTDDNIPRIREGPVPGHYRYHVLQSDRVSTADVAYGVYYEVLVPFSDLIFIFEADFGGLEQALGFLCAWVRRQIVKSFSHRYRIALVTETSITERSLRFELTVRVLARLRELDPSTLQSGKSVRKAIRDGFDLAAVHPDAAMNLIRNARNETNNRATSGLHFTAAYTKLLLQAAIAHFPQYPGEEFHIVRASRLSNPVPRHITSYIKDFLAACNPLQRDYYPILASALVMDAYPQQMHSM
jgi:hypothetical protein